MGPPNGDAGRESGCGGTGRASGGVAGCGGTGLSSGSGAGGGTALLLGEAAGGGGIGRSPQPALPGQQTEDFLSN